ncbi:MAG: HAMP domain-containing sensor histidine kinase [Candidatus Krumholzibacteriia bacterium]
MTAAPAPPAETLPPPPVRRLRIAATVAAVGLLAALLTVASCHDTRGRILLLEQFMAGQARGIAGAVLHVAADDRTSGQAVGQTGHVIDALCTTGLGVRFIEVAGDRGLAFATPQVAGLDTGVRAVPDGPPQEYTTPAGPVFEVAVVGQLPDGERVVVRVGLDPGPLRALRRDITVRSRLRLGAGAASLVLVSVLLLTLQRQAVLDRAVAKAARRLARHEEEARRTEKLAAMGALAAGVAHQLRNPLNSIHLLAQVLAGDTEVPESARTRARHIIGEAARIDGRIRQFMDFARPREPRFEAVAVDEVVRGVAELQAAARAGSGVEIVGYAPSPLVVPADRGYLVEILENLVRNAVQAGATKVMASLVADGEHLELSVADNGPGVPETDRERIFDLTFTTRPDGTGLGLAIVSQLTAALGGTAALADGPGLEGRGARFTVRLSRQRSTA